MSKTYVKNTRRYDFHIPLSTRETVTFRCRTVDPTSGAILATGYTPVSEEQIAKLEESDVYNRYVKKGFLEVYSGDAVPSGALLDSDLAASLAIENADLKAENAALKEALSKYEKSDGDKNEGDKPKGDKPKGNKSKGDKSKGDKE